MVLGILELVLPLFVRVHAKYGETGSMAGNSNRPITGG
jgi:hypothetical protein